MLQPTDAQTFRIILLAAMIALPLTPRAQTTGGHDAHHAPGATNASETALPEAEVRKVDTAQGKVTLRHGAIANLDMPPMTMVFTAKDPKMLEQVKVGDRVRFRAEKQGSVYFVTAMERLP